MVVDYEYFAADGDDEASSTIYRTGGPASQTVRLAPEPWVRRRLLRRRSTPDNQLTTDTSLHVFDTVPLAGIDPLVQLASLETLLTGRPYDDVVADPRCGHVVASQDGTEREVVTVTRTLRDALAMATDRELTGIADRWARAEHSWGRMDPVALAAGLLQLAGLARRAYERGQELYCWLLVRSPEDLVRTRGRA